MYWWIAVSFVVGVLISVLFIDLRSGYGTLQIDHSDPEKDLYRIVITTDLDKLPKKKRVVLKIEDNADLS
jgi:hypothetical protein|nr:MAG TPA: hypothetical protein [Caudoviricetes sp.]